ncbi:MAG: UDP-N-acetylglucosamine 2-epimerase (non-hydrolyzing) [Actinomycetota bacterium]|nr:UDP-N-acetylglucosamine 2-epimerase (non-hydrolyzing) [Actinomycetota bacterium]
MIKKKIAYIIGTRPEIIRSAIIINNLKKDPDVEFSLVHTGQHYDYLMDNVFFDELRISEANVNLGIGSGSHSAQTAQILMRAEEYFLKFKPEIVAVFGDTNSSLAACLAAVKLNIPVAHLEAGCREWEMDVPEEINRRLIDHSSRLLLAVSESCARNLEREKVQGDIHLTGDPLFETFLTCERIATQKPVSPELNIAGEYALLTLHRQSNVDDDSRIREIIGQLSKIREINFVFPVHPRTRKNLEKSGLIRELPQNFTIRDPLGYMQMLLVLKQAKLVVTDSGGLQKEAFWSRVPCITLRKHTAWHETVELGVNFLAPEACYLHEIVENMLVNYGEIKQKFRDSPNPYAGDEIAKKSIGLIKEYAGKRWG